MPSALFSINADATNQGFDGTDGQALTVALRSSVGVQRWQAQVFAAAGFSTDNAILKNPPRQSTGATQLVLNNGAGGTGPLVDATTPTATIALTLPSGESSAWILRVVVNSGRNAAGSFDPALVAERLISIEDANGTRAIVPTERTQYHDDGWTEAFERLRTGSGLANHNPYFDTRFGPRFLYNGSLLDESGNGIDMAHTAGPLGYCDILPGKPALYISNGTQLQVPGTNPLYQMAGDVTIFATLQMDEFPKTSTGIIFCGETGSLEVNNHLFLCQFRAVTGTAPRRLRFFWENGAGLDQDFDTSGPQSLPPVHTLVQVAWRRAGGVGQCLVNGGLFGPAVTKLPATGGSGGKLQIGGVNPAQTSDADFVLMSAMGVPYAVPDEDIEAEFNRTLGPIYGNRL